MKGFSLIEPWASLVVDGLKRIETRSWGTGYRGQIAIHASKSTEVVKELEAVEDMFEFAGMSIPPAWPLTKADYKLGYIIGVANLFHCQVMTPELIAAQTRQEIGFGAWANGRYAWSLGDAVRLTTPIQCRGALGLWEIPVPIYEQVMDQLMQGKT